MPIKRKIFSIGDSKAITLPKSWIEIIEKQIGKPLEEVAMEVNSVLTISPLIEGKLVKVFIEKKIIEAEDEKNV
jgi:antitoxin component of MazEF toxin-antitoxin module